MDYGDKDDFVPMLQHGFQPFQQSDFDTVYEDDGVWQRSAKFGVN